MEKKSMNQKYIVIVSIILATLLAVGAAFLPEYYTGLDVTKNHRYSVDKESIKFLNSLDEDITLYVVIDDEARDLTIETYFERFADAISGVTLEYVNISDTEKLKTLDESSTFSAYDTVVESNKRKTVLSFQNEMLTYSNSYLGFEGMGYSEYSYYLMYYQYYYNSIASQGGDTSQIEEIVYSLAYETQQYFCGESVIVSACEYVSLDKIPQILFVGGHGEEITDRSALGMAFGSQEHIDLSSYDEITFYDASCLVLNTPKKDISEEEMNKLLDYMRSGGRLLVITDSSNLEMKNLMTVLSAYGLSSKGGIVYEGEGEEQTSVIVPTLNYNHDSMAQLYEAGLTPTIINGNPITMFTAADGSLITTALLISSDAAYTDSSAYDMAGAKTLGAAAEEAVGNETSRIVWFTGSESFNSGELESSVAESNMYAVICALSWLNRAYDTEAPEIASVPQDTDIIAATLSGAVILGIIFILAMPLIFILWTSIIVYKRRIKKN